MSNWKHEIGSEIVHTYDYHNKEFQEYFVSRSGEQMQFERNIIERIYSPATLSWEDYEKIDEMKQSIEDVVYTVSQRISNYRCALATRAKLQAAWICLTEDKVNFQKECDNLMCGILEPQHIGSRI